MVSTSENPVHMIPCFSVSVYLSFSHSLATPVTSSKYVSSSPQATTVFLPSCPQFWDHRHDCPGFYIGTENLNSGLHVYSQTLLLVMLDSFMSS